VEEHEADKEATRADIDAQLTTWCKERLIEDGSRMEWSPGGEGCWMTTLRVAGVDEPYTFTEVEFEAFALGFNGRRTALMARRPIKFAAPPRKERKGRR